jgi:hypothetical protein
VAASHFQVQSLANHEEQRRIMPTVKTIGVACGGDYAGRTNGVIRSAARAMMGAVSLLVGGPAFEGRA